MSRITDAMSYPPRAFDAERAAAYVCLSKSKFLELVDAGDAPQPIDLGGCPRWDRRKMDDWLDCRSDYVRKKGKTRTTLADLLDHGEANPTIRQQLS